MDERGIRTLKELAVLAGVEYHTVIRRMKRPDMFRLSELKAILDALHATDEERAGVMFSTKGVRRNV